MVASPKHVMNLTPGGTEPKSVSAEETLYKASASWRFKNRKQSSRHQAGSVNCFAFSSISFAMAFAKAAGSLILEPSSRSA